MTKVIARVHPAHLMNVDWAPGGHQPSDQANRLGLWGRRKLAATVHIHHCHCCYYSARKLILILPSLRGWKAESTSLRLSSSGHNTDAARALAIAAASGLSIDGTDRRADTVPIHRLSPLKNTAVSTSYRYRPWGGETICRLPPPRRWQFNSRRIYVRQRTCPQSAHLWWPAVAKLQAVSVPIAYGSCAPTAATTWDRQTDGRTALSLNAPYGGGA